MKLLIAIIIIGVVVRIFMAEATTGWRNHDEEAHANYARHIWQYQELPDVAMSFNASMNLGVPHEYENYQQPLYYTLMAPFGFASQAMRYATIGLWLLTAIMIAMLTKDILINAFFAIAPAVINITGFVTNDSLLLCASAMTALGLSRRSLPVIAIGAFALALTKITGMVIVLCLLAFALAKWRRLIPAMTMALVAGLLALLDRWMLASYNSQVWQFSIGKIYDMTTGTLASITLPEPQGVAAIMAGITSAAFIVYVVAKANWTALNLIVVSGVVAIWFVFSLSHFHYIGRLLYPAIPFALIPSMSKGK